MIKFINKTLISLIVFPTVALSQSIKVEPVSNDDSKLQSERLSIIERELGILRHDFNITFEREFLGVAEVVALPSGRVMLSSNIEGSKDDKYYTSVILFDSKIEDSIYRAKIQFDWFSYNYKSQNKSISTSVVGLVHEEAHTRFDFPRESESDGIKTVWVFSLRNSDSEWEKAYALRIKSTSVQSVQDGSEWGE